MQTNKEAVELSFSSLLAHGISLKLTKKVYPVVCRIAKQNPQLNRYDILIKIAQKLAILL